MRVLVSVGLLRKKSHCDQQDIGPFCLLGLQGAFQQHESWAATMCRWCMAQRIWQQPWVALLAPGRGWQGGLWAGRRPAAASLVPLDAEVAISVQLQPLVPGIRILGCYICFLPHLVMLILDLCITKFHNSFQSKFLSTAKAPQANVCKYVSFD